MWWEFPFLFRISLLSVRHSSEIQLVSINCQIFEVTSLRCHGNKHQQKSFLVQQDRRKPVWCTCALIVPHHLWEYLTGRSLLSRFYIDLLRNSQHGCVNSARLGSELSSLDRHSHEPAALNNGAARQQKCHTGLTGWYPPPRLSHSCSGEKCIWDWLTVTYLCVRRSEWYRTQGMYCGALLLQMWGCGNDNNCSCVARDARYWVKEFWQLKLSGQLEAHMEPER